MGTIAQFSDIVFEISSTAALLLHDLKLTAESETDEKTKKKQKYITYKNGKAAQADFEMDVLSAFGQDVRGTVMKLLHTSQRGEGDYFYVGGEKIFPCKMIMTKAEASEIDISPSGAWVRAKISVSMKQADKEWIIPQPEEEKKPGKGGGGSGGGKKPNKINNDIENSGDKPPRDLTTAGAREEMTALHNAKTKSSAVTSPAKSSPKITKK